jgi:hypothetical protein
MIATGFGRAREARFEPPIEMRFVDFFMILVTALMFVTVMLSVISAFVGNGRVDVAPRLTTSALPTALLYHEYHLDLAAVGGANPYKWRIARGQLPAGIALSPDTGVLSGIPASLGRTQFVIEVEDAERRSNSREIALEVRDAGFEAKPEAHFIHVSSANVSLPDSVYETPYSFRFQADGGTPPYQWSIASGSIDPALSLTPSGELVGTPTRENKSWQFAVQATDATGVTTLQTARLMVNPARPSWWRRILSWLEYIPLILGYVLLAVLLWGFLFGTPPTESPGSEGLFTKIRRKFS